MANQQKGVQQDTAYSAVGHLSEMHYYCTKLCLAMEKNKPLAQWRTEKKL